ncbi:MAG: DUF4342 domain-containing protein [bacterium]
MVKTKKEESFKVNGEELLKKFKELVKEGNVRRITIKEKTGRTLIDIPLTVGVIGAVLTPVLAAVGAVAALISECTISVERETHE